ncbi:MAG: O-antigen ligase family protein [Actinomycetota bacterium]
MPDTATQVGVAAFSIVTSVVLVRAIVKTFKRDRDQWSSGALFGATIVILTFSFVQLLATYTDSWVKLVDVYRDVSYGVPAWGQACLRVVMVFTSIAGIWLFFRGLRRKDAYVNVPVVLLILVMLTSMGSALLSGDLPLQSFSLVYLCILMACVFSQRGLSVHLGIATVCVIAAVLSGVALIMHGDFSVIECKAGYKCGIFGFNFRGVLDNENALALYLSLAMPFVYIAFRGWEGIVMCAYMTTMILMTGSRSGTLAALATLAALLIMRPDIRNPERAPLRSAIMGTGLLAIIAVGVLLPFVVRDPEALTGRSDLWQIARNALTDPAVFFRGTGMFGWHHVHEQGLINASAVYSVHNQWLHVLFSTGIVGLILFLAAILTLLWQARDGYFLVAACVLLPCFILSATERPWPIDTADWLTWAVPGALLCYPVRRAAAQATAPDTFVATPTAAGVLR